MIDILSKLDEDIRLRGLSERTHEAYLSNVRRYLDFLGDAPIESAAETDLRRYSTYLRDGRMLTPKTINTYLAAVIFLYEVTLDKKLNKKQIPRMKLARRLPTLLSRAELAALMNETTNLKHRAILSLGYGSGLRVSEVCSLRVSDIDSDKMRLFVNKGKGGKDRYTVLSQTSLRYLREYWKMYRPDHPEGWMFPGMRNISTITQVACNSAFKTALKRIGIDPEGRSYHLLRHCFSTYMLEDGTDLATLKELLGHASLSSTTIYLHLANVSKGLACPIDKGGVL